MKKVSKYISFLGLALLVFSMSGCNGSNSGSVGPSGTNNNDNGTTTASKVMVLSSPVFEKNGTYTIYRGSSVATAGTSAKYYVAPVNLTGETVTMNLEFTGNSSNDVPFIVCDSTGTYVLFAYDPSRTGYDTTTPYQSVWRNGGSLQKQSYTGLELASASTSAIDADADYTIVLDSGTETATITPAGGTETTLATQNYVWHVSPDYGEYWTLSDTVYSKESKVLAEVTSTDGVYIARDIRYVPDTLEFSENQTAPKAADDNESMYVAYYNVTDDTGITSEDTWILAALPGTMGMGADGMGGTPPDGGNGGTPPDGGNPPTFSTAAITDFSTIKEAMTHSASEAYNNPVLHITRPGTYKISGTWNGQIWVDIPDESLTEGVDTDADENAHVILILNGVTVTCDVAPALVFKNVYEYGPTTSTDVASSSMDVGPALAEADTDGVINAGATIILAGGTTNTFTGTNVARLNKLKVNTDDYSESDVGSYVKAQKKMYKLDGAFHSRMSMVIATDSETNPGKLIIDADYEGLDSEEHMYLESGVVEVTADDDGINVNDDSVSVFHMAGGSLTVTSTGGDGIDSNGYIIFTSADKLSITASSNNTKPTSASNLNAQAEGPIDADIAVYMTAEVFAIYTVGENASSTDSGSGQSTTNTTTTDSTAAPVTDTVPASDGTTVATITYQATSIANDDLTKEERIAAGVAESGDVFMLVGTVNTFSGVK